MSSIKEAKEKLDQLKEKSKFEKMVQVTAILTKLLEEHHIRPIIVGGLAVEIYTRGDYSTVDIDLIINRRDIANEILQQLGFTREGRHWFHEQLLIGLEIPNDMLEDADIQRILEIQLNKDLHVYVIGIEDIILDRLRACVHWKSKSDCEWGKRLFLIHQKRIDFVYLEEVAKKDLTFQELSLWLENK